MEVTTANREKFEELIRKEMNFTQVRPNVWQAETASEVVTVEMGDWPASPLWLIYLDGEFLYDSDMLPRRWKMTGLKEFGHGGCLSALL
jgi:hypothetical protein